MTVIPTEGKVQQERSYLTCFGASVLCLSLTITDLPPVDHVSTIALTCVMIRTEDQIRLVKTIGLSRTIRRE